MAPLKHKLSLIIKIAIVIAAAFYIYQKVFHRHDLAGFYERMQSAFLVNSALFITVFLLVFLNWGLEAWKWRLLLSVIYPIPYSKAFYSVLAGVTTGVFTPNRAGEFGGRVWNLEESIRLEASALSLSGGFIQFTVTVLGALPAVFLCTSCNAAILRYLDWSLLFIFLSGLILAILVYLFRQKIIVGLRRVSMALQQNKPAFWMKIFLLSLLRYAVFSFQFIILLRGFGLHLGMRDAYTAVALSFFATTVIPTFALSEIGIRGSVSVLFVGMYVNDPEAILASSLLLWIINIAFPALVGALFFLGKEKIQIRKPA